MSRPEPRADSREISDEEIRLRAYFLFLECRDAAADAVHHWLTAERQLRDEANIPVALSARSGTRRNPRSGRVTAERPPATPPAPTPRLVRSRASAEAGTGASTKRHTRR